MGIATRNFDVVRSIRQYQEKKEIEPCDKPKSPSHNGPCYVKIDQNKPINNAGNKKNA
jgi:hypothetical protein